MLAGLKRVLVLCLGVFGISVVLLFAFALANPGWRPHFFSLLTQIWAAFAAAEGSSTLGLISNWVYTILVFGITLFFIWSTHGWAAVMQHWQKEMVTALRVAIVVSLLVYGPVFVWQSIRVLFSDHADLVKANSELRAQKRKLVDPKSRDEEIAHLKQNLADVKKESASVTPTKQDRADPLAIIHIASQKQVASADSDLPYGLEVILTTTKDISPTAMVITFSGDVGKMYGHPPGQIFTKAQGGIVSINRRDVFIQWETPSFSIGEPIALTVYSRTHIVADKIRSIPFSFPYRGTLIN